MRHYKEKTHYISTVTADGKFCTLQAGWKFSFELCVDLRKKYIYFKKHSLTEMHFMKKKKNPTPNLPSWNLDNSLLRVTANFAI